MSYGATTVYSISWDCETEFYCIIIIQLMAAMFSSIQTYLMTGSPVCKCFQHLSFPNGHVIFSGSFSMFTNNHMINVFTLVRASQNESPNSRYPRNPYYS